MCPILVDVILNVHDGIGGVLDGFFHLGAVDILTPLCNQSHARKPRNVIFVGILDIRVRIVILATSLLY